MVKGAAKTEISDKQLNLVIGVVARDPMLKEAFNPCLQQNLLIGPWYI